MDPLARAARLLVENKPFTVLTGAGMSAESGIPTFRGKDGLWRRFRPEDLATPEAFNRDPRLVWEWYKWRMSIVFRAKPNPGHYALVELERMGIVSCVITQNVDGLHQAAGQKCVVELHGSIRRGRCTVCGYRIVFDDVPAEELPRCPRCNGLLRPDVVWFGEPLPENAWKKAVELTYSSRGLLVVGTSGVVIPAGLLPRMIKEIGGVVIEVNVEETAITPYTDVLLKGKAGEVLPRLVEEAKKLLVNS